MKVKRCKQAKKILSFYIHNFGFYDPIQIIVDGTFCQAALKGKINLKEQLPKYLGCKLQLLTTKCIIAELASKHALGGAHFIAKRLQVRQCHHLKVLPPKDCILELVGSGNINHYCVATQDSDIQHEFRKKGSIPLLHIIRNTVVLEKPSQASYKIAEQRTTEKVKPHDHEQIQRKLNDSGVHSEVKKRKRKRPQGPNPLSVKKKKKKCHSDPQISNLSKRNKDRRLRMQRKKAIELLISKI